MKVLKGSIDQSDPQFLNGGRQCCAISIAALCKAALVNPQNWMRETVDECVVQGDKLYEKSVKILGENIRRHNSTCSKGKEKFMPNPLYLQPNEVFKEVEFENGSRVTFETLNETSEMHGTLMQNTYCEVTLSHELKQALTLMLQNTGTGLFTTCDYTMGVMKVNDKIWAFDSHKRGNNGLSDPSNGKAVLLEVNSVEELAQYYKQLFLNRNEQYYIIPIKISSVQASTFNTALNIEPILNEELLSDQIQQIFINTLHTEPEKNATGYKSNLYKNKTQENTELNNWREISRKRKLSNANKMAQLRNQKRTRSVVNKNILIDTVEMVIDGIPSNLNQFAALTVEENCNSKVVNINAFKERHKENIKIHMRQKYQNNNTYQNLHKNDMRMRMKERLQTDENYKHAHTKDMKTRFQTDKNYRKRNLEGTKKRLEIDENYRKRNLEGTKKRLEIDENYRKRNLEGTKKRLEIDDNYRKRNLEGTKKRLEVDENYRKRNLEGTKKRLQMDEKYKERNLERSNIREKQLLLSAEGKAKKKAKDKNAKQMLNFKNQSPLSIREIYREKINEGPTHICCCCSQLFFKQSIIKEATLSHVLKERSAEISKYRPSSLNGIYEICKTCLSYLKNDKIPPLAVINGLNFDEIPPELKDLTPLEERLVSARIPFMQIRALGVDRLYGLKGNCINVPVDINKSVSKLPRLTVEEDTVVVQLMRRMTDKTPYIYENVRPEKVFKAAQYLVNTELYKNHNITLSPNWITEFQHIQEGCSSNDEDHRDDSDYVTDEQWGEQRSQEEEAVEQQDTLLTSAFIADQGIRIAPGEGTTPISVLGDADLDALAFPTVYAGKVRKFKVKLTPSQIAKAQARMHDRRVATNVPCLMLSFCKARIHKLVSRVNIALRKRRITPGIKVSDILNENVLHSLIQENDGFRIVAVDRASPAFWESKKKTVLAMLRQYGPATFFLTFSRAESKWLELLIILAKTLQNKVLTEEDAAVLSWQEKVDLIKNDPITCARYFDHRFNAFWTLMKEKNGPFAPYKMSQYYIRFEMQFRGSIHAHIMVWINGAPEFNIEDQRTFNQCENFIDKFITCKKDEALDETLNRQYHKHTKSCKREIKNKAVCRFEFPQAPMRQTKILLPLDENITQERAKFLKSLYHELEKQSDVIAKENENCTFDEYLSTLNIDEETYIFALRSKLKRPTVFLKRNLNERTLNGYNPDMLDLWQANMDIQFILDPYACVMYVINYINKSQKGMSKLLRDVASEIKRGNEPLAKQLRSVINAFLNNSEISAQEIALHLLSIPMSRCSVAEVYINTSTPEERSRILKSKAALEKLNENDSTSTDIVEKNVIDRYILRPDSLETTCLADFAALFNIKYFRSKNNRQQENDECLSDEDTCEEHIEGDTHNEEKTNQIFTLKNKSGYLTKRKERKIIRYRKYNEAEDSQNFYRENIMLYTNWRIEPSALDNLKELYLNSLEEIHANRKHYCKNELFEIIMNDINENQDIANDSDESEVQQIKNLAIYEIHDHQFDVSIELNNKPGNDIGSNKFLLTKMLPEDDFLNLIRMLNQKQRKYLLNVVHIAKTKPQEQFCHFISGGAGVGKSYLIKAIKNSLNRFWVHRPENKPDDLFILLLGPTGTAAFAMGGITIHSGLHLGFNIHKINSNSKRLSSDIRNTLYCHYKSLKLIIIDEISMVGSNMFWVINNSLQEIFGNKLLFGGICMIVFGDFNQLPPVRDSWIFEPGYDAFHKIIGPYLWKHFKLFELTEIMRQRNDANFAMALNNLAGGNTTDDDDKIFQSREITSLNLDATELMEKAVGLFWTNHAVDLYNETFLSNMNTEKYLSSAIDICNGTGNDSYKEKMIRKIRMKHHKQTQSLPTLLKLYINARYVVTTNIDTSDGITNGASGILKHVTWGETIEKEKVLIRVYLEFKDKEIGANARNKMQQKMKSQNVNLNWTPIERTQRIITISDGCPLTITRSQFPLIPGQAITIHSSQGSTKENIMVDVERLNRRLLYTALSRVTSASGLYILGTYQKPTKPNPNRDKIMIEMNRMRTEANLELTMVFPEDKITTKVAIFHNVRSLNLRFKDITSSRSFMTSDILMFVETWLKSSDEVQIDEYTCIHRRDCEREKRYSFGSIAYAKSSVIHQTNVFFERCEKESNGYFDVVGLKYNKLAIIFLYKSPKIQMKKLLVVLSLSLEAAKSTSIDNIIIVGDFNTNYFENTPSTRELKQYIDAYNFHLSLQDNIPSTDNGTLIDLCFTNFYETTGYLFESVASDHKPLWFNIE